MNENETLRNMDPNAPHLVVDVESVGLHGEGFALAWARFEDGEETDSGWRGCPAVRAEGLEEDRDWIAANLPPDVLKPEPPHLIAGDLTELRRWFWEDVWRPFCDAHGRRGSIWADCGWPVEANFLSACMEGRPHREHKDGPYPLHEIGTVRALLASMSMNEAHEVALTPRNALELPPHHPLADARYSGRTLLKMLTAIHRLGGEVL